MGAIKKTRSIVVRRNKLIGSKKKLLKSIIPVGKKNCRNLFFVILGMYMATANNGEKFGGESINLLAINNRINITALLNISITIS